MNILKMKFFAFLLLLCFGCEKSFLDVKNDVSLAIPKTLEDYQGMLDNSTSLMNLNSSHTLGVISGDELDIRFTNWQNTTISFLKNSYIWEKDALLGEQVLDWNNGYKRIMNANMVLDALNGIPRSSDPDAWDHAKGGALFFRAFNFYQLAQLFCKPYTSETAKTDLGIPLRLEADITIKSYRATISEVYDQILSDLEESLPLLPNNPSVKMRPSKQAALALLSKVYLNMKRYEEAIKSSNLLLDLNDNLLDYSRFSFGAQYSFPADHGKSNPEVIFHCYFGALPLLTSGDMNVAEELLALYDEGDLRKEVFFSTRPNGNIFFRGSLTGNSPYFTGLTTSEILLIRAESLVMSNRLSEALDNINRLRRFRYSPDKFSALESSDQMAILKWIVDERRKELAFRGVRWEDLRRYNQIPELSKIIVRNLGDRIYRLEPNSPRYVLSIPQVVIELTNMPQNER